MNDKELDQLKQFASNILQVDLVKRFLRNTIYDKELILKWAREGRSTEELGLQVKALDIAVNLLETGFSELNKLREVGEPEVKERNIAL